MSAIRALYGAESVNPRTHLPPPYVFAYDVLVSVIILNVNMLM